MARVAVLLVNFRQWELTRRCVETLVKSDGVEVVPALVDNCSPGPVPDWVREAPGLRFRKLDRNAGFTVGTNEAFSLLENEQTDFVFVLNNDTEVRTDSIQILAEHLEADPDAGIATPAILYAERPDLVWSAGGRLSLLTMRSRQEYRTADELPPGPVACGFASGCAILMRTEDFVEAGGLDPDLFIYCDDNDICMKIRKKGLEIRLVPASRILHHVSVTVGGVHSPMSVYFNHRNRYVVSRRYLGPFGGLLCTLLYLGLTALKTPLYLARGRPGLIPWMWKAVFHGLQGRIGTVPDGVLPG